MYKKINEGWMKHWDFELFDIIMLEISFFISYLWRHHEGNYLFKEMYLKMGILLVVVDIAIVFFSRNYKNIIQRRWYKELFAVISHVSSVYAIILVYEFLVKEVEDVSRTVFLMGWGIAIFLCFGERIVWKRVIRIWISKDKNQSKLLIITSEDHACVVLQDIMNKDYREYQVCCVAVPQGSKNEEIDANIPILYGRDNLIEYIRQEIVDEVYIDSMTDRSEIQKWVEIFLGMGVTVHVGMGYLPSDMPNLTMGKIGEALVVTSSIKAAEAWKLGIKRIVDIFGAIVGLLLTGIAYIFVAPQIKLASPGPVFFKQQRVGKNGRIFNIYKFRSMYMDAEERKKELMAKNEMDGLMFKMENDPRIIGSEKGPGKGIGNFIRKTSIDELPQFWNVLKGDMSLVGTRPPTRNEFEQYDLRHKIRLSMKPGITGMWQTSGRSNITDFEEVVKLDTEYVENWSVWLDFKLLLKTVKVVLGGEGSK